MDSEELREWLQDNIKIKENELRKVVESNRQSRFPDIVARRVVETQIMTYKNILRKLGVGK